MKTLRIPERRSIIGRALNRIAIGLVVVLAAGCASANRLREAQDSFNQAAAAENAMRFDAKPSEAVAGLSAVRSGYASALLSLEKLEDTDQRRLRDDGLWGTALTLRALTQWRLGFFDKALASAQEAQSSAGDQMYPRDRAVVAGLGQARAGEPVDLGDVRLLRCHLMRVGPQPVIGLDRRVRQSPLARESRGIIPSRFICSRCNWRPTAIMRWHWIG